MTDPLVNVPVRDLDAYGQTIVDARTFADVATKLRYLARLTMDGARRADVFGVARLARSLGSVERCHAWVRDEIEYASEPAEKLETAAYIARERAGDCDGQGVCLGAMVIALGMSVALVPMGGTPEEPSHLATAVGPSGPRVIVARWVPFDADAPPGWTWTETTVKAFYGENPMRAAVRLGVVREDFRG